MGTIQVPLAIPFDLPDKRPDKLFPIQTFLTPAFISDVQLCSFGIIPPVICLLLIPSVISSWQISFLILSLRRTPLTSETKYTVSAFREAASILVKISALTFIRFPDWSLHILENTGILEVNIRSLNQEISLLILGIPTKPNLSSV